MKLTIRNIENKPFSKGWLKYLNNEITRFCEKEEKTIILTAHNHRDIENLCDVVYFMDQGRLVPFTDEIRKVYFTVE